MNESLCNRGSGSSHEGMGRQQRPHRAVLVPPFMLYENATIKVLWRKAGLVAGSDSGAGQGVARGVEEGAKKAYL